MIDVLTFKEATHDNSWRRIDENHPLDIFIGKDDKGRCAFEYIGRFEVNRRICSSKLIEVAHYTHKNGEMSLVLSLLDNNCIRQFCAFCNDIVECTKTMSNNDSGYEMVCNLFFTWQKMFKIQSALLSENEIKGLIGELLFLRDELIPLYGVSKSLSAWSGPDATKKDFSINETWYETKTIDSSKNSVKISSLEQLDSDIDGQLVVYRLEKMASEFDGISINKLVESLMSVMTSLHDKELFAEKLIGAEYSFESQYDSYVYVVKGIERFVISDNFPRLERKKLHVAINSATYELTISELLDYKI